MTQTNSRLIDEIARLATDAAAVAQGARREAETVLRSQLEKLLADANVVQRDEFEAAKAIAIRAADEADALRARVDALEERLASGTPPAPAAHASVGDDLPKHGENL